MTICGLEGSGFILAVGLTLILSGLIVYLMNTKISRLEKTVQNQNQVLTGIITNIQSNLAHSNMAGGNRDLASAEAIASAEKYMEHIATGETKIEVSDDDLSSSDSGSDSDDDSDSEDESQDGRAESATPDTTSKTINLGATTNNNADIINITALGPDLPDSAAAREDSQTSPQPDDGRSDSGDDNSDSDSGEDGGEEGGGCCAGGTGGEDDNEEKSAVPAVHTEDQDEGLGITENIVEEVASALESHSSNHPSSVNINRLKVPELKKMVSTQGLASPSRIQNMKKKDLIELLK
jgi:hypothetical protein